MTAADGDTQCAVSRFSPRTREEKHGYASLKVEDVLRKVADMGGEYPDVVALLHLPWHEALYRKGSYSWNARTIRTASTLPSHAAMLSGVDVNQHGLSWNNWRPRTSAISRPR